MAPEGHRRPGAMAAGEGPALQLCIGSRAWAVWAASDSWPWPTGGAAIAREAKALTVSLSVGEARGTAGEILYQKILDTSVRVLDPWVQLSGSWIVRRLAPDCSRVELAALPKDRDEQKLLHAMGQETANVHAGDVAMKAEEVFCTICKSGMVTGCGRPRRQWLIASKMTGTCGKRANRGQWSTKIRGTCEQLEFSCSSLWRYSRGPLKRKSRSCAAGRPRPSRIRTFPRAVSAARPCRLARSAGAYRWPKPQAGDGLEIYLRRPSGWSPIGRSPSPAWSRCSARNQR